MDFDTYDGNVKRAKALAITQLQALQKYPQLYLILTTSASEGWHRFVFSAQSHPIAEWVLLLKRTADTLGAEIRSGVCEIYPNETRTGSPPHAISGPGIWNAKTNHLGAIFYTAIAPLL